MKQSLGMVITYVVAVFVYSTIGVLTKNINVDFYIGTLIGAVSAIVFIWLLKRKCQ